MTNPIRLLHHLACSGGTVMSRCIAAQPGVCLLSEIHPSMNMRRDSDPLKQAQLAYGLIDGDDLRGFFIDELRLIHERCEEKGLTLVVRDHASADFLADEYCGLETARVLGDAFEIERLITVRHPIDAWLGMDAQGWMPMTIEQYCTRFARFAAEAARVGFVRYEQFVANPDASVKRMCECLGLNFANDYQSRLDESSRHLTGASGRQSLVIGARPRRPIDADTVRRFEAASGYQESLELLGYQHPLGVAA